MGFLASWTAAPLVCLTLGAGAKEDPLLKLDYDAFDQRPGQGWRALAEKGRYAEAARLIDRYRQTRQGLDESQQRVLSFHAGQMYAFAGDYKTAVERFRKSKHAKEPPELPIRWNAYVDATIAFLTKDLKRLKECREEIAKGPTFQGTKANLDVVDGLIEHSGEPYSRAYGAEARKPAEKKAESGKPKADS